MKESFTVTAVDKDTFVSSVLLGTSDGKVLRRRLNKILEENLLYYWNFEELLGNNTYHPNFVTGQNLMLNCSSP